MSRRTVVLVHGAWHGAWCWERVGEELEAKGIPVVVPDLPGHGSDPRPPGDLHTDAARVAEVISAVEGPVVLVGHSYGGAVVTEAGVAPSVEHLVYVAAFNLDQDESVMSAAVGKAFGFDPGPVDVLDHVTTGPDGMMTVSADGARLLFYNDCTSEDVDWATRRLCPQPSVALGQTPSAVAWRAKPSTYAVCSDDAIVPPGLQRLLAARAGATVEWPTGHSPFISRPDLVTALLADLSSPA